MAGGLWQQLLPWFPLQQQFFIFPRVKRKNIKGGKGGAEVLVWIYTEIYIVEWASLFLVLFDICQNHWNVSQSAGSGRCWLGMAASHWHMDWCISKGCCLFMFWVVEMHFKRGLGGVRRIEIVLNGSSISHELIRFESSCLRSINWTGNSIQFAIRWKCSEWNCVLWLHQNR